MRHIEIHVIETESDAASASTAGLIPDAFFTTACSDCGDDVGALENFEPYCAVLDGEAEWYLCTYCAEPVIEPEYLDLETDYVVDDDFYVVDDD